MFKTYYIKNAKIEALLDNYCERKGELWRIFFGYRGTAKDGSQIYRMPKGKVTLKIS